MDDKSRFLELLAKKKLNNATLNDIAELNLLCKDYEIDLNAFNKTNQILEIKFSTKDLPNTQQTQKSWENFKLKVASIEPKNDINIEINHKRKRKIFFYYVAAASFLICIGISFLFFRNSFKETDKLNIISTQNGSKSKVQMPDGTQVWLNSGSKITYNNQYGIDTRTVTLIGEAFFDVKHDAKHPFIIHTKNLNLKVLGTAFNVRAYANDPLSEATLVRGSLQVSFPNRPDEKMVLKPKEKVSYNDVDATTLNRNIVKTEFKPMITLTKVEYSPNEKVIEEIAWKEDKLIFRSKEFNELALDLERWYNVKIEIENNSIKGKKFTGIFKNESVFEALNALKQTYSFNYVFDKTTNKIVIN
ncbi:MAG: FecR domain-containing protein [Oligoflexus sp.]|nr:FecR domain-containing protein [Pseudopedobacter sp.]